MSGHSGESEDNTGLSAAPAAARREGGKDVGAGGAVAPGAGAGVTLEQVLMHNFHNNRVEGLRRMISGEKGSQVSGHVCATRVVVFRGGILLRLLSLSELFFLMIERVAGIICVSTFIYLRKCGNSQAVSMLADVYAIV